MKPFPGPMISMKHLPRVTLFLFATTAFMSSDYSCLHADEGMWLFNNPPRKYLREKYDFEPSEAWLKNLQQSAVRFNSGGSGAFISAEGLVITNHHVGADALQKLST